MSKLSQQFTESILDKTKANRQKPIIKNFDSDVVMGEDPTRFAKQVKVFAKFEYIGWIDYDLSGKLDKEKLEDFMHNIKRSVIEDVFGEFRPLIIEMRTAIYDDDMVRLKTLLAQMENQMFTP
jgi:hypothetical protein